MNLAFRQIVFLVAFLLLGVYSYFTLTGPQGISALLEKRREIHALEVENANLVSANQAKRERLEKFRKNSSEQDLEIRKRLRMLKQDETEFILPPSRQEAPKTESSSPQE